MGGLFVRTNHPFAPGTLVDLTLHLPEGRTASLKGRVKMATKTPVVSLKNGMGIEILGKDTAFIDFVKSLSNEEPVTEEESSQRAGPKEEPRTSPPGSQDFSIILCSGCGVRNRVLKSRISKNLRCGKCGASLSPSA